MEEVLSLRKEVQQLRQSIRVDALTNLYNFKYFKEALATEMERTRRTGLPTGLIMADLDHFKAVNDNYGHEAGNKVLVRAASLWRRQIRQLDIPCRYGGEEFAIIMPGTRFSMAVRAAERLRSVLADNFMAVNGQKIYLTASFGVACFQIDDTISLEGFIDRTDRYLLAAKQSGRNRVCFDKERMDDRVTEISPDERKLLFADFSNETENTIKRRYDRADGRRTKRKDKGPIENGE